MAGWGSGFDGANGTDDKETMIAFANLMVTMGIECDEQFLEVWTDHYFSNPIVGDALTDQDTHEYLGSQGIIICHALFHHFRESEYGSRARCYMSLAIDKEALWNL